MNAFDGITTQRHAKHSRVLLPTADETGQLEVLASHHKRASHRYTVHLIRQVTIPSAAKLPFKSIMEALSLRALLAGKKFLEMFG